MAASTSKSMDEDIRESRDLSRIPETYRLMHQEEDKDMLDDHLLHTKRLGDYINHHRYRHLCTALKLIVLCLAGWGVFNLWEFWPGSNQPPNSHTGHDHAATPDEYICDCGSSTKEAVSLGCQFVPMAAAWLPPACIDEELSHEFNTAGPGINGEWTYWADRDHLHEISEKDVSLLADTGELFYGTWEWHVKHCTFQWRLDYRRRWLNTTLEPRYDHESHITHCQMIIFADRTKSTASNVKLNSSSHMPPHGHEMHGKRWSAVSEPIIHLID
ncbi:hypothetical protein VC83_07983 [Pseudogymnoascus destructans]|uniref:Uncharacterized protein n=2 Tax=Pseudogymnoascus destructans TaxID=655981 RepID=L8FXN3_PSED2|nr:uncharacterized protein VC83_07983 [Pseudogymnoascus destructans]ELR05750.1 hypothetical protein GMDG_07592 [Pseudogymnoascus destructans 20631-21]OAF55920.1 hypothetical protein VC83_07983 [Pseudogymnoascus destructans]